jgi:hypothetical protein
VSLIRKSDVKSHLATRNTSVYPFGLKKPDSAAEGQKPGAPADISISPSHPIAPEGVPNAQVGGSVGVPAGDENSGKGSW